MLWCVYIWTILFIDVNSICHILLGTCFTIVNFSFIDMLKMDGRPFTNIILTVMTTYFIFSSSFQGTWEYSIFNLFGNLLTIFLFRYEKLGPNTLSAIVIYSAVIGKYLKTRTIFFISLEDGLPIITWSS